jgi:hypothetical protein
VGVITEGGLKLGSIAERPVDLFGQVGPGPWVDVRFDRAQHRGRWVLDGSEDRLATDHHDLGFAGQSSCGGDEVIEVRSTHPT